MPDELSGGLISLERVERALAERPKARLGILAQRSLDLADLERHVGRDGVAWLATRSVVVDGRQIAAGVTILPYLVAHVPADARRRLGPEELDRMTDELATESEDVFERTEGDERLEPARETLRQSHDELLRARRESRHREDVGQLLGWRDVDLERVLATSSLARARERRTPRRIRTRSGGRRAPPGSSDDDLADPPPASPEAGS